MKFRFEVQGSASEPYVVIIEREGNNLTATCDCPAGSKRQHCKHRFRLLAGSAEGVIGGDISSIPSLPQLLDGTDVETALRRLQLAEKAEAEAKAEVQKAKAAVASAMHN